MSLTMEALSRHRTLILCAAAFGASVAVGWFLCASKKKSKKRKLQKVGEVSQLFIHPIKSMRGVSLSEAECEEFGLKNGNLKDRHWLVVTESKVHVSARQEPRMVLISVSCNKDHLVLNAPEMEDLKIPLILPKTNSVSICKVWGNEVPGRDCGEDASHWITNFLKAKQVYRLMHFENKMKPRNPKNEYPTYTENDQVAYPDLSPLLLLSEASLDDLNTKLQKKVTIRHFRPNIVITGCSAFEEDSWKEMQIGNHVTLKQVMPCPRCILTTVDPDTGVIDMKEPLETLRSYRLCDTADKEVYKDSPLFGHFLRIEKNGKIKVGDPVYQITY
ncbi:mitochondrial amidoxime reducing component 2 isoform X1 [Bombina bombina]|uniref:mitochondrial amidoxime reducing component 2 isoform X1 n=1 Tax=Bombina bombina TaxID=8345 RepID=UPI00235B0351|nr:mitochondrial amidoxime reducing component 2 isoform X1 [Bombina bombina]